MATPVARSKPRKTAGRGNQMEANQAPPAPEAVQTTTTAPVSPANPGTPPPPPTQMVGTAAAEATGLDLNAPAPPMLDESGARPVEAVGAGWFYTRMITYLWSYNSSTGVWVWVDGIGWKRLSPVSEHGHTHMAALATLATDRDLPVDYHEDASGQIDQILV